jgi:hypothetical protein
MIEPVLIEPEALYDDGALRAALGLTASSLANADFRGQENNQVFGGRASPFSGDFFVSVPRSLFIFPAQHHAIGVVSAIAKP